MYSDRVKQYQKEVSMYKDKVKEYQIEISMHEDRLKEYQKVIDDYHFNSEEYLVDIDIYEEFSDSLVMVQLVGYTNRYLLIKIKDRFNSIDYWRVVPDPAINFLDLKAVRKEEELANKDKKLKDKGYFICMDSVEKAIKALKVYDKVNKDSCKSELIFKDVERYG